jgi:hypothetical protein
MTVPVFGKPTDAELFRVRVVEFLAAAPTAAVIGVGVAVGVAVAVGVGVIVRVAVLVGGAGVAVGVGVGVTVGVAVGGSVGPTTWTWASAHCTSNVSPLGSAATSPEQTSG